MKTSDPLIILTYQLNCSLSTAWTALTNPSEMKKWYFGNIPNFIPEIGFKTAFLVKSESRSFTHNWEITAVVPNTRISYSWVYDEYPGKADVTFKLNPQGDQTELILTVEVKNNFPNDIPEFQRQSCIDGWNYYLGGNLMAYLSSVC